MEKLKIHKLRVSITEHLEYFCRGKRVHRTEPPRKFLLLEHCPPEGYDNLLAVGDDGDEISGKEFDFQVYVPERIGEQFRIHPDTSYDEIQSHHWIKLAIRISRSAPTPENPNKRKQYELSIDSPIHVLSPFCVHANTLLPTYTPQILPALFNNGNPNRTSSIDVMMSPILDGSVILGANLYGPTDSEMPAELMSPQAKPMSPTLTSALNSNTFDTLRNFTGSPISKGFDEPPPAFNESVKDQPPTYEEATKRRSIDTRSSGKSSGSSDNISYRSQPFSSHSNENSSSNVNTPVQEERQSRPRRNNTDDGDLGGSLRFRIQPLRSRSPSRGVSPVTLSAGRRSKLIRSSLLYNSSGSSNAIDATLAAFDEDDSVDPLSPPNGIKDTQASSPPIQVTQSEPAVPVQGSSSDSSASKIPSFSKLNHKQSSSSEEEYLSAVEAPIDGQSLSSASSNGDDLDYRQQQTPRSAKDKSPLFGNNSNSSDNNDNSTEEELDYDDPIFRSPLLQSTSSFNNNNDRSASITTATATGNGSTSNLIDPVRNHLEYLESQIMIIGILWIQLLM
ncbi:unnamed protein product [Ambrosiozyma monospora]|uniref:Unnamed protein product n=1 Tax=Ambrosiozyma monospora TaxID=43982 RepID=A0ACB5T7K7_AMBMO|nr:unnamed protein product [Ambrosiozyma monospora]